MGKIAIGQNRVLAFGAEQPPPKLNVMKSSIQDRYRGSLLGLACGDATVGHIGAATRHAYTAIGDCVNVAARLETLSKELGYPLVLSHAVVDKLAQRDGLVALGVQPLKGHTPLEVYGWQ